MTIRQKLRILVDVAMTALLLPLMAYSLVGEAAHEWLGLAIFVLLLVHHALNFHWYRGLAKRRWNPPRVFQTAVNFALLLMMLGLMASGIILSREVFVFLPVSGGTSFARTLHMVCAYWGFCLMSLHIGSHWNTVLRKFQPFPLSRKRTALLGAIAVLVAGYGIYAFIRREIGMYMLLKTAFVFFDFEEPLGLFFLDYLAVMGLFAVIGYYAMEALRKWKNG